MISILWKENDLMHRFWISLLVVAVLYGCGSTSNPNDSSSNISTHYNSVESDNYTFTLTVDGTSETNSIFTAELSYEGEEANVLLEHNNNIISTYEVLNKDNQVIYSTFTTQESAVTTLSKGESVTIELNISVEKLSSKGEYTLIAVASFTDTSTNKDYELENIISFEVE